MGGARGAAWDSRLFGGLRGRGAGEAGLSADYARAWFGEIRELHTVTFSPLCVSVCVRHEQSLFKII